MNSSSQSAGHCLWASLLLVTFLISHPAFAGKLSDFETDAAKKEEGKDKKDKKKESKSSEADGICMDAVSDEVSDEMCSQCVPAVGEAVKAVISGLALGGLHSWERINPQGLAAQKDETIVRKSGEALIPFLRLDMVYQNVESDVAAWDYLMVIGYGALGFQARRTVYEEKESADTLRSGQYHVLYRLSYGSHVEVDLGIGGMFLNGKQENSGLSIAIPVLYHPSDFYGFEFRPVWSSINENDIQDFDLAILLGWRYASIKAGYRWLRSPHQSLDGPEIGIALRW